VAGRGEAAGVKDRYLRGALARTPTARQVDVLAAFVAAGGSFADAAARVCVRPSPRSDISRTCERAQDSQRSS